MSLTNQEKGRKCEESFEPLLRRICPTKLEHVHKGADRRCGDVYFEIKSCHSGLTPKQRETKARVEKSGGKYHVLRCPCETRAKRRVWNVPSQNNWYSILIGKIMIFWDTGMHIPNAQSAFNRPSHICLHTLPRKAFPYRFCVFHWTRSVSASRANENLGNTRIKKWEVSRDF